jgi:hypothetical protein
MVAKNCKFNRLHTVGVGSGVSEMLIKNCALNGGGKSIFVADGEDLEGTIIALLESVLTPYLSKFSFDFDKNIVDSIVPNPEQLAPIIKNEPFNIFIFFKQGINKVDTYLDFTCFDSKLKTKLKYHVKIQNA